MAVRVATQSFSKESENPPSDNLQDKDRDKPQKPEARSQIDISPNGDSSPVDEIAAAVQAYNDRCGAAGWPRVQVLSKPRRSAIAARLREVGQDGWVAALDRAARSRFLTGQTEKPFFASFDWLTKPANLTKVVEGNYDNRDGDDPDPRGQKMKRWNKMGR